MPYSLAVGRCVVATAVPEPRLADEGPVGNPFNADVYPTTVERNSTIVDGEWNDRDEQLVFGAMQEDRALGKLKFTSQMAHAKDSPAAERKKMMAVVDEGVNLLGLSKSELASLAQGIGMEKYRGSQLHSFLYTQMV